MLKITIASQSRLEHPVQADLQDAARAGVETTIKPLIETTLNALAIDLQAVDADPEAARQIARRWLVQALIEITAQENGLSVAFVDR